MDKKLITKIAKLYYLNGLSYKEISLRLNISIAYISKLLNIARETGIVEIKINDAENAEETDSVKYDIINAFSLKDAYIVKDADIENVIEIKKNIGESAATYLYENLPKKSRLGITWGTTISYVVQSLRNFKKRDAEVDCIQLLGNLTGMPLEEHGINLVASISKVFTGNAYLLHVPAVLDNQFILEALKGSLEIKTVFKQYNKIDYSIASVGSILNLENSSLYKNGYFDDQIINDFKEKGIVGDVLFNFFTIDGKIIETIFKNRIMGISSEDYLKIPNKIIVSAGSYKVPTILGAVKAGLVDILITDLKTAKELLYVKQ